MENYGGEFYLGRDADFLLISSVPIILSNLSVFYIRGSEEAEIASLNNEKAWTQGCGCQTLNGTSITFKAEANPSVQIVFNGNFTDARDVVAYINAYNSGAAIAAGWKAYHRHGYVVIASLQSGAAAELQSLEVNFVLGFNAPQTVFGTDQQQVVLSGINFELLSLGSNMYAVTFYLDRAKFFPGEAFFLEANVSPILIQNFFVRNPDVSASVNFVG